MTREEAIKILQKRQRFCKVISDHANATIKADELQEVEAIDMAISTLRPVSREQVERMRSRWITVVEVDGKQYSKCAACQTELDCLEDAYSFCPHCGAPMTDEAVEMVLERLNKLED